MQKADERIADIQALAVTNSREFRPGLGAHKYRRMPRHTSPRERSAIRREAGCEVSRSEFIEPKLHCFFVLFGDHHQLRIQNRYTSAECASRKSLAWGSCGGRAAAVTDLSVGSSTK